MRHDPPEPDKHNSKICENCAGHGTAFAERCQWPNESGSDAYMVAAGGTCVVCHGTGRV